MIRFILTIIGVIICYLLQSSVFTAFALANIVPDILMIMVITAGYTKGKLHGLYTGLLAGLMIDCCIGSYLGLYGAMYMIVGYLAGYSYKIYDKEDYTLPMVLIGIGEFLYQNMYYVTQFLLRGKMDYFYYLRRMMLPRIIYTLAVGIFLYKLFHVFHQLLLKIEQKEES